MVQGEDRNGPTDPNGSSVEDRHDEPADAPIPSGGDQRDDAATRRDAAGDQRDVAGHQRDVVAQRRDLLSIERDEVGHQRDQAATQRDVAGDQRDQAADQRDHAADQRDYAADERDHAAERSESRESHGVVTDADARAANARREAASDRRRAAQDRGSAASERTRAGLDRDSALADRGSGASERAQAGLDRDTSQADRGSGAAERAHAGSDRGTSQADRGASAQEREREPAMRVSNSVSTSSNDHDVQLGLLGSFSLRINDEPLRLPMSAQRLVSFLALHDGFLQRQHVAGSLWSETSDRRSSGSLRSALWRLGHPTHPLVEVAGPHLRLSPIVMVDVDESTAMARRVLDGSLELSEADSDGALLAADLLPDWTEDWVLLKREAHTQLRLRALEALCRRLTAAGRFGQAVQAGLRAVSGEPLRESAQRALVEAHIAEGNMAATLERYESFRVLLFDELGVEPSAGMQALVRGLTR